MAGNKEGGLKAKATNLAKDPNFYERISRRGGKASKTGGFKSDVVGNDGLTGRERARIAGAKGGRISRRTSTKNTEEVKNDEV